MRVLIDDRLLRAILLEREPQALRRRRRGDRVWTTGAWLYRLCQAVADPQILGSLSGPLVDLPERLRAGVVARLVHLPDSIGVVPVREIAWDMGVLVHRHRLNYLALEALATARLLDAAICVGEGNVSPKLQAAAGAEGVAYRVISN